MAGGVDRSRRVPKYALDSPLASARRVHVVQAVCALVGIVVLASATSGGRSAASTPVAAEPIPPAAIGLPTTAPPDPLALPTTSATHRALTASRHAATRRPTAVAVSALAGDGIPVIALHAYKHAAAAADKANPRCGIIWPLLAAIGRVESDHGRFRGSVVYANGVSAPHIVGIALNGVGTALIRDTDHGRLDGDKVYDRAVGPMQFIPSTWAIFGADGNGDRVADPFNLFDAAQAAANYLCRAGGNLTTSAGQIQAVMSYNHSVAYLRMVVDLEKTYAAGLFDVQVSIPAGNPPTSSPKRLPPVNEGPPIAATTSPAPKPTPKPTSSAPTSPATSCPPSPTAIPTSATPTSPEVSTSPDGAPTTSQPPTTASVSPSGPGCASPTPTTSAPASPTSSVSSTTPSGTTARATGSATSAPAS